MIAAGGRPDADAFLVRLLRLDPRAVVRLRPTGDGEGRLWARLPFGVVVARAVPTTVHTDITVDAGELLAWLRDGDRPEPVARDPDWRWSLPPSDGRTVEEVPVAEVARVAAAAARTLRSAATAGVGGRAVGERAVRDALLDHVPIVVTGPGGERVDVSQRLVQAVVRMGFLPPVRPGDPAVGHPTSKRVDVVTVRRVGTWVGLAAAYGSAWYAPSFPLRTAAGVDVTGRPFR
jgi:hypothetical protein